MNQSMKLQTCKLLLTGLLLAFGNFARAQGLTVTTNVVPLAVGSEPAFIAMADMNGDGRLDLITANNNNTLSVLTNGGGGAFTIMTNLPTGNTPSGVVAADLNGDGKTGLAVANSGDSTIEIFTNNGTGKFGSNAVLDAYSAPRYLIGADIRGIGKLDLISANSGPFPDFTGTLTVLTNDGAGHFGSNDVLNVDGSPNAVLAADVNGDGKLDLVCANSGSFPDLVGTLNILTNNGLGKFIFSETINVDTLDGSSGDSGPISIVATDVNGDGKIDLITANSDDNAVTVFTNNGQGNFSLSCNVAAGNSPNFVTASDLNGSGKPDLIVVNFGDKTLTILTNAGAGVYGVSTNLGTGLFPECVRAADLTGDGKPDFVVSLNGEDALTVFKNTSTFPAAGPRPLLSTKPSGPLIRVVWPSNSPGWSLQQSPALTQPQPWFPSGYAGHDIDDDGTNKSLIVPTVGTGLFYQLQHP
jgi:hypothetical protein